MATQIIITQGGPTDLLGAEPVTILRFPEDGITWDATGRPVSAGGTIITAASMSVQPFKMREWQALGLGGRLSDWRKVYTQFEIKTGNPSGVNAKPARMPDILLIGDLLAGEFELFRVFQVDQYDYVCPHWKGIIRRIGEEFGAPV